MPATQSNHHGVRNTLICVIIAVFVAMVIWCGWLLRTDNPALTLFLARIVLIFTGCISLFLFVVGVTITIKIWRRRH
ncbi:hypothetical protein PT286_06070 [Neisseriaceae bacterium ESL0693]|nr:hypothetical protein [Neisseriaceae bacterium ESL0693]